MMTTTDRDASFQSQAPLHTSLVALPAHVHLAALPAVSTILNMQELLKSQAKRITVLAGFDCRGSTDRAALSHVSAAPAMALIKASSNLPAMLVHRHGVQ